MAFDGWSRAALDFYAGLEADNSKAYWTEHKKVYESAVKAPMAALLEELEPEFGTGKIFRPNRDIRFSADKSPYKTQIGATVKSGGYIQFSADGLAAGAGYYVLAPDQLERYRLALDEERGGEELLRAIAELAEADIEVIDRDVLKTAPRGYDKDHPRIDLLRKKDLVSWASWPIEPWLHTAEAEAVILDFLHGTQPLLNWLERHVGPSTAFLESRVAQRR